ncbi:apolipoprotein N-acyltransferase [Mariniphaga anaerophila]|nr:apolipoprotein N-acyltransferase [Mariniphaga anaerophila]
MSRLTRDVLSISTGVLLSLAWLGFPGWVLFFAFFPLLLLENFFVSRKTEFRGVSFWGHAFLAFLIWNIISTWWISYATVAGALMAIVANSLLMSLVWWLGHAARRNFRANLGFLALAVFWISFEYFHFHWDIEWPWLNLGNGLANNVKMIQWYEYTGVLGGTVWILAVNIVLFNVYLNIRNSAGARVVLYSGGGLLFLLLFPWLFSRSMYNSYVEDENPLNVLVVQPNIDPYNEAYDAQAENKKLNVFTRLADSKITENTDLVIGPETVFERYPDWNVDNLEYNYQFRQLTDWMSKHHNVEMLFGASTCKVYRDEESASSTARKSNEVYYDVYNSAVFVNENGEGSTYHKSILVPGVEKMPFRKYMGFLKDLVIDLGGTTGSLGRQDEPSNFTLKNQEQVAPVICYESVFGEYLTRFVSKGAGLVVVITNDGWWRNTPGYKQHLSYSRLRAIETRRSVARSANTGISCFVNQRGDILQATNWWEEAAIAQTVNLNDKITFYVKHGDFIARVAMFMAVLILLFLIVKRFIKE